MGPKRDSLRVAVAQMSSTTDIASNLRLAHELVRKAALCGCEVVLLPENFAYHGAADGRRAAAEALDVNGPIMSELSSMARAHEVVVIGGAMPELSSDPQRPYQTCAVVGSDGKLLASYRKLHLFDVELGHGESYCEPASMSPGDSVKDVAWGDFRVGLSICYDLRFPELYQELSRRRVDLITVPASFAVTTGKDHWHVLLRARAIETQSYVAAAAQWGRSGDRVTYGKSLVVDPWGEVIAQCSEGEGIAVATLNRDYLDRVRRSMPLKHRL
jgi:predicted amidohydrolase